MRPLIPVLLHTNYLITSCARPAEPIKLSVILAIRLISIFGNLQETLTDPGRRVVVAVVVVDEAELAAAPSAARPCGAIAAHLSNPPTSLRGLCRWIGLGAERRRRAATARPIRAGRGG